MEHQDSFMKKKALSYFLIALLSLAIVDALLSWLFTGLSTMPTGIRPAYTVADSRSRDAFIAHVTVTPDVIDWKGKRIAIKEAWVERRTELVWIYVFIPFVVEHYEYKQIDGYNLCINLSEGRDALVSGDSPFFVLEGRGNGFGMLGSVIMWDNLEQADFGRLNLLVTDNWKFKNALTLELTMGRR
jgi:hypothetical protein